MRFYIFVIMTLSAALSQAVSADSNDSFYAQQRDNAQVSSELIKSQELPEIPQQSEKPDTKTDTTKTCVATSNPTKTTLEQKKDTKVPVTQATSDAKEAPGKKVKFGPGMLKNKVQKAGSDLGVPGWRITAAMIVLVAVLMGFVYFMKKFRHNFSGISSGPTIQISSRLHFDNKNSLVLVKVHEEELLLSVSGSGINMLSRHASLDEEVDSLATVDVDKSDSQSPKADSFFNIKDFLNKRNLKEAVKEL